MCVCGGGGGGGGVCGQKNCYYVAEIILNLGQWFRGRCCLKDFLSEALAALMLNGAEPFIIF